MTSATDITVLTKDHIKFIRSADKVVFRYVNECSTVEIDTKLGAHLDIRADFSYRGYGFQANTAKKTCTKAFAMIHTPQFSQDWMTVAALLKPGDTLECSWLADSNGYVRVAKFDGNAEIDAYDSLHLDQMALIVHRGKQRLQFNLCLSVCPSNTARMFQYNGGF